MSRRGRSMRGELVSQRSHQVPTTSRRALRESSSSSSSDEALEVSQETENDLRRDEKKRYAVAACKYILNMSKKKVPIKCSEVVKHCMRGEAKLFPEIFAMASKQLADVSSGKVFIDSFSFFYRNLFSSLFTRTQLYGLDAHETRDEKSGKIILCLSSAPAASELEFTQQQRIDMQLLFIVLSYIHMKGGTVAEGTLFGFLKRLEIEEEPHYRFGYFKKTITDTYVRQLYLKREKTEIEGGNVDDR